MKIKIKWKNVIMMILFVASLLVLIHDLIIIATTLASYTMWGVITFIATITTFGYTTDYLEEEYKKVSVTENNRQKTNHKN